MKLRVASTRNRTLCLARVLAALFVSNAYAETPLAESSDGKSASVDTSPCLYTKADGSMVQVRGLAAVPEEHRSGARCLSDASPASAAKANVEPGLSGRQPFLRLETPLPERERSKASTPHNQLVSPSEIDLAGSIRKLNMNSALGPIELRWPRSVEVMFGRTPERAMADAALTASRALKQKSFPPRVKNLRLNWQVVFMDDEPPAGQVPEYLRQSCHHPGWMTPPANIYIVASRVSGQCSGRPVASSVADAELSRILLHEIGHAIEFYLLTKPIPHEPMRSEGFATWFESFAANYSSTIGRGTVEHLHRQQAQRAFAASPSGWNFRSTPEDYSRSAMYFLGIESRFGISRLLQVYERVANERRSFFDSAQKELVLKQSELEQLAIKAARR